jgi:hypothetical protein
MGDKFANVWPVEQFAKFNIRYEQSALPKSELYQSLLPLINSHHSDLLDHRSINWSASNGTPPAAAATVSITCRAGTTTSAMRSLVSPTSTIDTADST